MLKLRILTAIVLIALLLAAIYILPLPYFSWVVGIVTLLGAWEWAALSGLKTTIPRILYAITLGIFYLIVVQLPVQQSIEMISGMAVMWWLWSLIWLMRYQRQIKVMERNPLALGFVGILVLIPFWFATVFLNLEQKLNPAAGQLLLFVIIMVAISDTSAYFVGRKWGKHKLASRISPGKTWEGFFGSVIMVSFFIWPVAELLQVHKFSRIELVALSLVIVIAGVLGDLYESLVKRLAGVKDSGTILPGHGGILDRIDAYTAVIPIFMAIYFFWNL